VLSVEDFTKSIIFECIRTICKKRFFAGDRAGSRDFLDEARREGFEVYGIELNRLEAGFIKID
jgi:hypothetical protein